MSELVPHRGPALLLRSIAGHAESESTCRAVVDADVQYVNDGRADAALALELLAQTVAVHVGLRGRWSGGQPRRGYVISVPKMRFTGGDYRVGDELLITVRVAFVEGPVGRFEGEVRCRGELRAAGSLTVFEPPVSTSETTT